MANSDRVYAIPRNRKLTDRELDNNFRAVMEYRGTWASGNPYPRDAVVVHSGATWVATKATVAEPAGSAADWDVLP